LTITGGSSILVLSLTKGGDNLQSAAALRKVFDVDVEDLFPLAHARRRALRVSLLA
jgi:hypothetical protein